MGRSTLTKTNAGMKTVAAIDVGTNCALLLVANVSDDHQITPLFEQEKIIRLGEGVDESRRLLDSAISRAVHTLQEYREICEEWQAETIYLTGTSAVRDALNQADLLSRIASESGLEMEVLTGKEEATRMHFGALSNKIFVHGQSLTVDIGGGSTEFVLGDRHSVEHCASLHLGSVRLTERFIKHDPPLPSEIAAIIENCQAEMEAALVSWKRCPLHQMVAGAGTATTVAAMLLRLTTYDPALLDGKSLQRDAVESIYAELQELRVDEISGLPGIVPQRAPVMVAGVVLLLEVMRFFGLEETVVSDWGLRHGTLLSRFGAGGSD